MRSTRLRDRDLYTRSSVRHLASGPGAVVSLTVVAPCGLVALMNPFDLILCTFSLGIALRVLLRSALRFTSVMSLSRGPLLLMERHLDCSVCVGRVAKNPSFSLTWRPLV